MEHVLPWNKNLEQSIEEIEDMIGVVLDTIKEVVDSGEVKEGSAMILHIPKKHNHNEFGSNFNYKGTEHPKWITSTKD